MESERRVRGFGFEARGLLKGTCGACAVELRVGARICEAVSGGNDWYQYAEVLHGISSPGGTGFRTQVGTCRVVVLLGDPGHRIGKGQGKRKGLKS